jgi:hypothetical protein
MSDIMRRLALLVAALIAIGVSAGAANAEPLHWSKPAWYALASGFFGASFIGGPYTDKATCDAQIPKAGASVYFSCEYYGEKPKWDV